jgi:hypothetical protein
MASIEVKMIKLVEIYSIDARVLGQKGTGEREKGKSKKAKGRKKQKATVKTERATRFFTVAFYLLPFYFFKARATRV